MRKGYINLPYFSESFLINDICLTLKYIAAGKNATMFNIGTQKNKDRIKAIQT